MRLDFKTNADKLFTPLFFKIRKAVTRYLVNFGGAGSGKSFAQHQSELLNLLNNEKGDILFMRKHATDIHDSCYTLLKNIAAQWNITDLFEWTYSNAKRQITCKHNGKRILFKGIDDPEKLKSIVGIRRIIIEEASQLEPEDFLELNRRARGFANIQIVMLLNPISQKHWIKKTFLDSEVYKEETTILHTTYLDNKFLFEADRKALNDLKEINYNHYRIYALGEWGIDEEGSVFFEDKLRLFEPSELLKFESSIAYIDVADEGNDYLAMAVAKNIGKNAYITDVIFNRKNTDLTLIYCAEMIKKHDVRLCRVEANNMGAMFARELQRRVPNCQVLKATSTQNKHTRIIMDAWWIHQNFMFLGKKYRSHEYEAFINNVLDYDKNGDSDHDDAPDCLSGLAIFVRTMLSKYYS